MNLHSLHRLSVVTVRRKLAEERRSRQIGARAARHLTPPPPSAFGAFGTGSVIGPPARVTSPECIFIGDGVVIHEHAWISVVAAVPGVTPRLVIGDGTLIDRLLHIACVGEIEIGPDVMVAERVLIGDTYHEYQDVTRPVIEQPMAPPRKVTIGRGVAIGLGSCIMPGVTIGENAYIAVGTVVNRDVPPRTVVAGNPGRVVRSWDEAAKHW
jgi:abequosyltransferase